MERNLRLYPIYQAFWNALFWMPVFFLYFSEVLAPAEVLRLEAIYYVAVVVLEVPSGYLSDRFGRRATLLASTLAWVAAGVLFASGSGFAAFAIAQVLLAAGMAFNSGTDTSLLYESLDALGPKATIAFHEARAQSSGFIAAAVAAIVGGLVAGVELRLAYVLSAIAALGAFLTAWRFVEPTRDGVPALSPLRQVVECGRSLRQPVLLWIFGFAVVMTVFNHVPYEFFQPWLDVLIAGEGAAYDLTPAVAGVLVAIISLVAAWTGRRAPAVEKRLGTPGTLLFTLALQAAIMAGMALFLHPLILVLIAARSVPRAIAQPVQRAAIHPRVHTGIRATFLSMQSLAGRLGFSASLAIASFAIGDSDHMTFEMIASVIQVFAIAAAIALLVLSRTRRFVDWGADGGNGA